MSHTCNAMPELSHGFNEMGLCEARMAAEKFMWPVYVVVLNYISLKLVRLGREGRKCLEYASSHCDGTCGKQPLGCLSKFLEDAKGMRDRYAWGVPLAIKMPVFPILKRKLKEELDEWNELVEEYELACDPEVGELLTELSELIPKAIPHLENWREMDLFN